MSSFLNGKVIDDYTIVVESMSDHFGKKVTRMIREGYIPWGSPYHGSGYHCQAIIKFKEITNETN